MGVMFSGCVFLALRCECVRRKQASLENRNNHGNHERQNLDHSSKQFKAFEARKKTVPETVRAIGGVNRIPLHFQHFSRAFFCRHARFHGSPSIARMAGEVNPRATGAAMKNAKKTCVKFGSRRMRRLSNSGRMKIASGIRGWMRVYE